LDKPVCQRGFAVINVGNDAKIADKSGFCHWTHYTGNGEKPQGSLRGRIFPSVFSNMGPSPVLSHRSLTPKVMDTSLMMRVLTVRLFFSIS
jgi:hypothetical protein